LIIGNTFPQNFVVLLVKFPCAIALHLFLYPQVEIAMGIMKFANNQSDLFVPYGSEYAFMIGFFECIISVYCELLNIYMLSF